MTSTSSVGGQTDPQETISAGLWAIHEAAMDAANEPSRDTIRAVQEAVRKMERGLPGFYQAADQALMERARAAGQISPARAPSDTP